MDEDLSTDAPTLIDTWTDTALLNFTDDIADDFAFGDTLSNDTFTFANTSLANSTTFFPSDLPTVVPTQAPSHLPTHFPTLKPTWPPPPPANETNPDVGLIESTDTSVLGSTIIVYGSLYLILLALFCVLRLRYNKYFNIRSWAPGLECDIAKNSDYGLINWIWRVFRLEDDDILAQCGMDALCFLRVLRFGRKVSLVGCLQACWLIPVYATAEDSAETWYLTDSLVLISTAHLPIGSPRFLATVICAYICFGYTMWLIKQELQWYTNMRHKFLCQRRPRNYAVYVSGIPEELRSGTKLAEFFRQSGATSSVLEAVVTLACPELEYLVAQREDVRQKLEHAKAFEQIHGRRKTKQKLNLRGLSGNSKLSRSSHTTSHSAHGLVATVDSVERLEQKLRQLTKDIAIAYQNIERSNDPYTLEQHRDMVMGEIEEMRQAERAQNIANRERVNSFHDTEQVEEICHVEEEEFDHKKKERPRVSDRFTKVAEAFFFGDLPRQPITQEQRSLVRMQAPQADKKEVEFQSSHNEVHYLSWRDPPSTDGPEFYDEGDDDGEEKKIEHYSPRNKLVHNAFPSKSTITTVPGTFENKGSSGSSQQSDQRNTYFKRPGGVISFPRVAEAVSSDSSETSEDGYTKVRDAIRRLGGDSEEDSEGDETSEAGSIDTGASRRSSGQSWSTKTTSVIRRVSVIGGDVAKNAVGGVGKVTKKSLKVAGDIGISNIQKVGELGVKNVQNVAGNVNKVGRQAAELGVENIKTIRQSAAAVVPVVMAHEEGKALEGGFVVFKDLYSTQAALQMLHHKEPGVMEVSEAPGPDEIFWRNVGLPGNAKRTGKLLSLAATVVLCLFWTVPVSFISALTEVNSLKENVPIVSEWVEKYPSLEDVLALIAPLLLLLLQDVVLPEFLMWFAAWEGHVSSSTMESAVFVKYAAFVLVQTFFISAISGSISAELANMINEPDQFIDFLANALPAQSNYFLQILVVAMAVTMGLEMLRVSPLGLAFLRRFVGPNLTSEERTKRWKFITPLEDPREFEHANISGSVVLYFMVFFVYCCLAPVSCFFLLIMFFLMESGYRYNFTHNYPPTPDSGGKLWKGFFHILLGCMIVAQLTIVGFLVLKNSLFAIPFMVPLLVISVLFILYLNNYKLHAADHLPTSDCVRADKLHRLRDFDFVKGKYLQPCIREAQSDEIFEII